jgi:hypothetical protein
MATLEEVSKVIESLREEMKLMRSENASLRETFDVLSNATEKGSQCDKSQTGSRNELSYIPGKVIGITPTLNAASLLIGMPHYQLVNSWW